MRKKSFAKQLSQSFLRKQKGFTKQQGFALSIDALLATVLTLSVLTFVGFGMQSSEESITPSEIRIRQSVDDTFTVLDNSGFLVYALVDATETDPAVAIFEKAKTLLSKNIGLGIEVTEYEPKDDEACDNFADCFGPPKTPFTKNIPILPGREIMHGRKILIAKSLGADVAGKKCKIIEIELSKEKEKITAMFEEEEEGKAVLTQAIVTNEEMNPISELSCDDSAIVTLKMKDNSRDPIAVVMAMDRSESMEEFGIITNESSRKFNEGTCQNEEKWVISQPGFGEALHFNGVRNYGRVPYSPALNVKTGITISAWVKADSFKTEGDLYQGVALKQTMGTYEMWIYGNQPRFGLNIEDAGGVKTLRRYTANAPLNTDIWYHLMYTYDGQYMKVYIDNVERDSRTYSGTISEQSAAEDFWIGYAGYSEQYFNGLIDDVRIYNRELDAGERAAVFAGDQIGSVSNGLLAWWKFDEGTGNLASDSSGNGNIGELWNWAYADGSGCQYNDGEAGLETTNCPPNKSDFSSFTYNFGEKPVVTTYNTSEIWDDAIMPNSTLDFVSSSKLYGGACINPYPYMRLWVERPDMVIESSEDSGYWESVANPQNGEYKIYTWSDNPVDYDIYGRQRINSDPNNRIFYATGAESLQGNGTADGRELPE